MSYHIYLNAKVSQLLLKYCFLLFEPNILLHGLVINKSTCNDLPSKQHENQTSETYDCRSSTRNVTQPKFVKSQSYNTLHFIESQCYTTLHFIRKRCLTVICFQKQKGAGYFMHLLTFITSTYLAFYVWRYWPFKHDWISIIEFLMSQVKAFNTLHKRQKYRAT